ncbi:MAG: hypothetical protein P8M12_00725 [Flavobacteriales bacterium]|nr:hypothetical protein [Flavobacteriales bacterium]
METKKKEILGHLNKIVAQKINDSNKNIKNAIESRNEATKSSAGDKHETSRALIQIEIDKHVTQLNKGKVQKNELNKIQLNNKHNEINFGSLVIASNGIYFIGIGIGQVNFQNTNYFCISLASPIGKLLFKKKEGDIIHFGNKEITVLEIH